MSSMNTIIGNVWDKIDALPLNFNFSESDLEPCINDAVREMGIQSIESIQDNSRTELFVELRSVYYFLMRVRNASADEFKYSTGSDGKTVDKTKISDTIGAIMDDLDAQFQRWTPPTSSGTSTRLWNMTRRTSSTLQGV